MAPSTIFWSSLVGGGSSSNDDHNNNDDDIPVIHHHHHHPLIENMEKMREKAELINLVLLGPEVDLWKLRELAISEGGLVNDQIRRRAWPKLIGIPYQRHYTKTTGSSSSSSYTSSRRQRERTKSPSIRTTTTEGDLTDDLEEINTTSSYADCSNSVVSTASSTATAMTTTTMTTTNNNNNKNKNHHTHTATTATTTTTAAAATTTSTSTTNKNNQCCTTESLDYDQIERDVARCTWHLLTGSQRLRQRQLNKIRQKKKFAQMLKRKQKRLSDLINLTLVSSYHIHPEDELDVVYHHQPNFHKRRRSMEIEHTTTTETTTTDHNNDNHNDNKDVDDISERVGVYDRKSLSSTSNDDNKLRYYQGYHDVASIFLVTLGGVGPSSSPSDNGAGSSSNSSNHPNKYDEQLPLIEDIAASKGLDLACRVLRRISQSHLREPMRFNFKMLQITLQLALFPLLKHFDPSVHDYLRACDMEPFFCPFMGHYLVQSRHTGYSVGQTIV